MQRTADAVQVFGGSDYSRGLEVERLYRDAKITEIYTGTNRIQRMIVARELVKKGARTQPLRTRKFELFPIEWLYA